MKLIDNASGNVSQGITLDSTNKADSYRLSYNCRNIGSGKSFIRIYATVTEGYKTYFMPVQFNGEVEFELSIDNEATLLQFDVIGDATITGITFETVVDATMEYVKENASYWDRIKEITSNTGKVRTDMLEGLINLTLNAFANESGTITQENGIMTWLNGTTVENSTEAVQIVGGAIRVADSKLPNGEWNWSVSVNGRGINAATIIAETFAGLNITAVNIVSGTITGGTINGVTINGSKFVSKDSSGDTMTLDAGRIDFRTHDGGTGILNSDELGLWNNNMTVLLEAYNSFSLGTGSVLSSSGTMIVGSRSYSNRIEFSDDGYIRINSNMGKGTIVEDDFEVWGDKQAVVPTQHYGVRSLYAEEADKSYFSTKGIVTIDDTEVTINLDPIFMEVIELNSTCPYMIQLTAYSDARVWVEDIKDDKFTIKSDKPTKLTYDLKAVRISYENVYLEEKCHYTNRDLAKIQKAAVDRIGGI